MFAKRLAETIDQRGLSRYKIAQDTMITEATLSNYCNGKGKPSPSIVKQLADYLKVNYDWLLNGNGKSDAVSDPTETYRKRKKKYPKNDAGSMREYFEKELARKDAIINNQFEGLFAQINSLSTQMNNIEEKFDLLIKLLKLGKK